VSGYIPAQRADRDLVACWHERDELLKVVAQLRRRVQELEVELARERRETEEEGTTTATDRTLERMAERAERQWK
jgi:hypothetical protein